MNEEGVMFCLQLLEKFDAGARYTFTQLRNNLVLVPLSRPLKLSTVIITIERFKRDRISSA